MTALAHPSSTNLTVPTSQNTAPVLSFSCLYTHDIRRKQKRWQDGILRFHTFNKRIMVYDTPRNFIGDTHWRETQAIQDGDELELEKGVLIQVGEEVERTETDLTGLLEKRTPKHPAGRDRQPSPSTFQTTGIGQRNSTPRHSTFETHPETPFAQLRPKSLNALLGKPRGPVGKAVVTVKSPADLRKEKENGFGLYASSSKRRRVDYPTTAMPTMRLPTDRVDLSGEPLEKARNPASKARGSSSASRGGTNVASEAPQRPRNPATSEGHVSNVKRQPKEPQGSNGRSNGIPSHITQASNTTDGDHARSRAKKPRRGQQIDGLLAPSGTAKSKKRREATSESLSRDGFQDNIALEDSEPRGIQVDDEPRPEHMLRILSRKPRKKLLYRDLLPQKAAPHQNLRTPDGQSRRETRQRTTASRSAVGKRLEDPLDAYHQAQQSRLQTRLTKRITGILPGQQSLRY
ncbi:MAG: hypothetical protein L6R39_004239, partial [Caloplaca ligustica]